MIKLGICGFGYTGSGAVVDLLKEFDNVILVGGQREFILSYFPDGLEDLEYHLIKQPSRFFSSDIAIMRFMTFVRKCAHERNSIYEELTGGQFIEICEKYINKIIDLEWKGRWMIDPWLSKNEFIRTLKYRLLGRVIKPNSILYSTLFTRKMRFSVLNQSFYEETEKLINTILGYDTERRGVIAINQPFPSNAPYCSMRLFGENTKAIIVDRNPRDLYILVKEYAKPKWMPLDNVDDFILYYKKLHLDKSEHTDVLRIQFEDLIFNYLDTINLIMKFSDLTPKEHVKPFEYFDPQISLKNTRLFEKTTKYSQDISRIEKELPESLYDFSQYSEIDLTEVQTW